MIGSVDRLAIVQPRVGIGDMVWHLPHIRTLARLAAGQATLVTRKRSFADQLVGRSDGIADIFWIERDQWSPEGRHQGMAGFARLIRELRARRFDAVVFLTRSRNLAFAALAAGIPCRYGYGIGIQRLLLNRLPHLPRTALTLHPFDQAGAWLGTAGLVVAQTEPWLPIQAAAAAVAAERLDLEGGRFVALGIAGSDAWKKWGAAAFADLATRLLAEGWAAVVLIGGPAEGDDVAEILTRIDAASAARVRPVLGWDLRDVAALLQGAAYYVGNDTAALNIAAAVGIRAYGLFGATPVLCHSSNIVPITPDSGPDRDCGMARLSVDAVLQTIAADRHRTKPTTLIGAAIRRPLGSVAAT